MEDLNPQVVKAFGRKFKSCSKVRGTYICCTDNGMKQIKKLETTKEAVLFQNTAKELLHNKKFNNIDRFYTSADGMPYYIFNDTIYVMSDYIEGVECDLSKNLKLSVEQLAQMHIAAQGLNKCNTPLDMIAFYKKRIIEMSRLKKRINNMSSLSDLDIMILKNYDYYYNQCLKAIDILENSEYKQLAQGAKNQGLFCHNNYREENIIINVNGTYTVNFENCSCDIQMVDLANIIRRYMKKPYCEETEAYQLLEIYNNIRPISKEEMKVLLAMLIFPYKFIKVCNLYYNKRRSWVQNGISYSLGLYLSNKEKNAKLLELIEKNM